MYLNGAINKEERVVNIKLTMVATVARKVNTPKILGFISLAIY